MSHLEINKVCFLLLSMLAIMLILNEPRSIILENSTFSLRSLLVAHTFFRICVFKTFAGSISEKIGKISQNLHKKITKFFFYFTPVIKTGFL